MAKMTMDFTFKEMANSMGVTMESLAQLPLTKVIDIFNNFREGKSYLYKFECDIILNGLQKTNKNKSVQCALFLSGGSRSPAASRFVQSVQIISFFSPKVCLF